MAKFWVDFINGHIPNFRKTPYEQIDNYVKGCWEMIVETAKWAEKDLPGVLDKVKPDVVCVDNVILFPAIKRYARDNGKPWVRIISCSENEIEDPDIPPHLSGCGEKDKEGFARYRERFNEVIKPIHDNFNEFLKASARSLSDRTVLRSLAAYEPAALSDRGEVQAPPQAVAQAVPVSRRLRAQGCALQGAALQEEQRQAAALCELRLAGLGRCRSAEAAHRDARQAAGAGAGQCRRLHRSVYGYSRRNVHIDKWYPQPSVIPQVDAVIHHGGNNSFTECLYFGKPAIIMPYVWDGHDNATRVQETGHGFKLDRYDWTDEEMAATHHGDADRQEDEGEAQETSKRCERARVRQGGQDHRRLAAKPPDADQARSSAPHLANPASYAGPLKDWGHQPNPIAGNSKNDGVLLHKGPNGQPEVGLWQCTPGTWPLSIPRDELCYFVGPRHLPP